MIVLFTLRSLPLVERFVNDQHAKPVAGIKKVFGHLVVRASDGVVAIGFHKFHLPLFGTIYVNRSQQSVVVMDAASFQFHRFAVQQETFVGREREGADAERNGNLIIFLFVGE